MTKTMFDWSGFSKENVKYYLQGLAVIMALMWTWGYISFLRSDVFDFSRSYIASNAQIIASLGEIKSTRLGFINFQRKYAGGIWTSEFNVVVEGSNKSGTVYFSLKNDGSGWVVEDEKLEMDN